jgi:putative phosphoesterase
MRLAVLADIHGNFPALEAVLSDLQPYDADGVIVAGDLIGGPQPVETIRVLRSLNGWMIRGNSDTNVLSHDSGNKPDAHYSALQFALIRWTCRHIDPEALDFLMALPEQCVAEGTGAAPIRVVHGSPRNPSESIFPDRDPITLDVALAQVDEPVLVCGHTHRPWKVERGDRLALNPGSVCGPLDGQVGAQYALMTWSADRWQVDHHIVSYDLGQVRAAFHKSGLLEEGGALARAFLLSIETGQNVVGEFLAYAYSRAAEAGYTDFDTVPDDIWKQAIQAFWWDDYVPGN